MQLKHSYYFFESALTHDQCDEIIETGENAMDLIIKSGGSIDAKIAGSKDTPAKKTGKICSSELSINQLKRKKIDIEDIYVRDTHISWINNFNIYEMLHPYVHEANYRAGWNFDWDHSEDLQYTKYGKKQFYGWHADSDITAYPADSDPNFVGKIRKLSMTVNLSDSKDYTGGNLRFDFGPHADKRFHVCKEIRPRGSIVVFPSHVYHQVTPIKSGVRRSLVMWSLGMPFK